MTSASSWLQSGDAVKSSYKSRFSTMYKNTYSDWNAADVTDARAEVDSLGSKGSGDAINKCVQLDTRSLLVECDGQCHSCSVIVGVTLDSTDNIDAEGASGLANVSGRVTADGTLADTWDIFNLNDEQVALAVVSDNTDEDCCSGCGQLNEGKEGSNASKSRGESLHG